MVDQTWFTWFLLGKGWALLFCYLYKGDEMSKKEMKKSVLSLKEKRKLKKSKATEIVKPRKKKG